MLNKTKVALLGAIAVATLASTGAQAATQTATAEAEIVAAVQLAQNDILDFGIVASSNSSGIVTLPIGSDTRVCATTVTCVGSALRGRFTVSGAAAGLQVAITVSPLTTLSSGGGATMGLSLLPSTSTILSNGNPVEFYVGGTLTVGANQAAGNYTGTYVVTANYQ